MNYKGAYTAIITLLLAASSAGTLHAEAPACPALIGQWRFETSTGTSVNNGVPSEIMGEGLFTITRSRDGLAGTISWLDEQGHITSGREVQGHADGNRAVFTHTGKRVTRGRDGKEFSAEVTVRWTLRAEGERLIGERLVETDEDEPKPVLGQRVAARDLLAPAALVPAPAPAPAPQSAPPRGPSTPAERERVVRIARDAERDPRQVAQREGAWLKAWADEVPDFTLQQGPVFSWLGAAAGPGSRDALQFQYVASAMAFQIGHPAQKGEQAAIDAAGMTGVLRAYEVLVRQDPRQASARLDRALAARDKGQFAAFLATLSGRDPVSPALVAPGRTLSKDPVVRRIVALGSSEPRAMAWLDILSNRFGGRMTGSDAYTHAAAWTRMQFRQWGVQAELEEAGQVPVGFNRGPWSARMLAPQEENLRIATPAYTAGTKGVQRGLVALGPATLEEAQARAAEYKDKWVLIGGRSNGGGRDGEYRHQPRAIMLALQAAGALGTLQAADEPLYSGAAAPTSWELLPSLPDIKLAAAQYADIRQRAAAGEPVALEFDIRNWFYPGPVTYHNVVASIPGTEAPGEIVLLGAHLDSFDGATGAADNGGGVATMMEAMRLLAASGEKPRRTIMLVLFGAEESGLKGASAFVERHADRLPGVVMMLNRDARPGALSGITVPPAWGSVFKRVEQDLAGVHPVFGFESAIADGSRGRRPGNGSAGSDDAVFAMKGIPTPRFTALTDFDYERVHHTVADTYENVLPFRSAQQYSAIALAVIAHEVANAPAGTGR